MLRWFKKREGERKVEAEPKGNEPEIERSVEISTEPPSNGDWLETVTKDGQRIYIALSKSPIEIGTADDCDVKLPDNLDGIDKIKPKHARLELWRGRWVIAPSSLDAPVFVNGKRTGENALKDGMEVCLGEEGVKFVFREAKARE